jgi:DNA-binding transcriptional ArsR family regulator
MLTNLDMAQIAALIGDPARANILAALMDGRALTATELAYAAGVSPQTTSGHLAKLAEGGLLGMVKQGRHRYYRLASPQIGRMLEGIMAVASDTPRRRPTGPLDAAMRQARSCYDHFAGRLGVDLAQAMSARGQIVLSPEGGEVTRDGLKFLDRFGIDAGELRQGRRAFFRPCLDWSERRLHIGGAIGAALSARCFELGWVKRRRDSRAVIVTPQGMAGFKQSFGFRPADEPLKPPARGLSLR